jgi:hypothetical protein
VCGEPIVKPVHLAYNSSFSACFLAGTVFFLSQQISQQSSCSFELFSEISSHPAVFFSHNKPANSTFSHSKPAKRTGCFSTGLSAQPEHTILGKIHEDPMSNIGANVKCEGQASWLGGQLLRC